MLVLTRSLNEEIVIAGNIRVRIADIDLRNGRVRLGVIAPKEIPVFRRELVDEGERKRFEAKAERKRQLQEARRLKEGR